MGIWPHCMFGQPLGQDDWTLTKQFSFSSSTIPLTKKFEAHRWSVTSWVMPCSMKQVDSGPTFSSKSEAILRISYLEIKSRWLFGSTTFLFDAVPQVRFFQEMPRILGANGGAFLPATKSSNENWGATTKAPPPKLFLLSLV